MWRVANGSDADVVVPREDNISITLRANIIPHYKGQEEYTEVPQ